MTWNWIKKAIVAVWLASALSWSIEAWDSIDKSIVDTQEQYKKEIAKNLSISNSGLSKLGLIMDINNNDWKKIKWTLVAWPAMLEEQHCDDCEVPYSKIGLDYVEITKWDKQLAEMLADGEEEFFGNLKNKDLQAELKKQDMWDLEKEEYNELWQEIAETIWRGNMDKRQLEILEKSNTNMLLKFLKLDKNKYELFYGIWELKKEQEWLKKEQERWQKIKERWQKIKERWQKLDLLLKKLWK